MAKKLPEFPFRMNALGNGFHASTLARRRCTLPYRLATLAAYARGGHSFNTLNALLNSRLH